VEGVNPDYATLIRAIVILAVITLIVAATGACQPPAASSWWHSSLFLGERLTLLHGLGVALIAGGAILVAL
jgi:uncharacterized membrane protein